MRVALWGDPRPFNHPMGAAHAALAEMADVDVVQTPLAEIPKEPYDVLLTWNGLHAGRDRLVPKLREQGKPVVVMERGFFDRMNHSQVDHKGFNHNASWAHDFNTSKCQKVARAGYILVLLQKANDTQLWDAPFREPGPFIRAVEEAFAGEKIRIRAHPKQKYTDPRMIDGTLRDALDGARFAVTINSNAGNDAICWDCPVLSVGPSIYKNAGMALGLNGAAEMLSGWEPEPVGVANYCEWLSTKQHSLTDIGAATKAAREKALDDRNDSL